MHLQRKDRLRLALSHLGLSKGTVATKARMHRQVLTDMLGGRVAGERHLERLATVLEVDRRWLEDGSHQPKWLAGIAGIHHPPSDEAEDAQEVCKEILLRWSDLRRNDAVRYDRFFGQLSAEARRWVTPDGIPKGILTTATLLELGSHIDLPKPESQERFIRGHEAVLASVLSPSFMTSRAIPDRVFWLAREGLLLLKAQRKIRSETSADLKEALQILWSRHIAAQPKNEARRDLTKQMEADLKL